MKGISLKLDRALSIGGRRWRQAALLAGAAMAVVLVAACSSAAPAAPAAPASKPADQPAAKDSGTITWRLATGATETQALGKAWAFMANSIKEKTGGKITVQTYFANSLYGERTAVEAALSGAVDIGTSANSQYAPFTDAFLAFDLPFVVTSDDGQRKLLDSDVGKEIRANAEKANLKILAMNDNGGFRPLFTTKKKVKVPADLKGMKFRTVATPVDQALFSCWGAIPTPVDWAEVYTALQQGVVEGEAPTYTWANAGKHYDILKYVADVNYVGGAGIAAMSLQKFNALPADLQKAVLEAGKATEQFSIKTDADDRKAAKDAAVAKGLEVYVPTEADMKLWQECATPIYESNKDKVPLALIEKMKAAAK